MVLIVQGTKQEEEFFDYFTQNIYFWQAFFLLLWSFFTCCKGCDFFPNFNWWLVKRLLEAN